MRIDRAACEFYCYEIETEPAVTPTQWEASFDGGGTYVTARNVGGWSAWLVAGPAYAGDSTPDFTLAADLTPVKVRLVDSPETVIRQMPAVQVVT